MEIRLGPHNLADALPTLLRTVSPSTPREPSQTGKAKMEGEWVYPPTHIQQQQQQMLDNCQGFTASLQQQQRQPIRSDQVSQCVLQSFRISYRVRRDDQGRTVGGGVNQDRDVLRLSLDQPCLTECLAQQMVKGFASCLN